MLFELITESPLNIRAFYERTHITAIETGDNTYTISHREIETNPGVDQLEEFIRITLTELNIGYLSLKLLDVIANN